MSNINDFIIKNGMITKYNGKDRDVVVPDGVMRIGEVFSCRTRMETITIPNSVKKIDSGAFLGNKGLKSIVIPNGVTSICPFTFSGCISLASVTIPNSVTRIWRNAFSDCTNLTSVTIPDSVTSIDDSAFSGCHNLTTITIPYSVASIGDSAFSDCTNLTSFTVDSANEHYNSVDDVLFNKDNTILIQYPIGKKETTYTIPDSVTSIGERAFCGCENLTSVTVPSLVTCIEKDVFKKCTNLGSIILSEGLKSIDENAFCGCLKLETIVLPRNADAFEGSSLEVIWNSFSKSEYKMVVLRSFLTQLLDFIRVDKKLLTKIKSNRKTIVDYEIANDDTELLEYLFSLYTKIKLDDLNEYIEKSANAVKVRAFLLDYKTKNYSVEKQEAHENDKVEKELGFKERTLADWRKIYKFTTNGNEATIEKYKGTDSDVAVPAKLGKYTVTSIASCAFCDCTSLTSVIIPDGVKSIGVSTFNGCTRLDAITIPDSVTSIGDWAFKGCTSLTSITIPDSVTSIGRNAFKDCTSLTSITISDSVLSVDGAAFENCTSLASITIPDSVTSIGYWAFKGCISLASVTIPNSVTSIDLCAFFEGCKNLTIHAPAGSYAEQYAKENKIKFIAE